MLINSLIPTRIDHPFVFSLHGENRRYSLDLMLGDQNPQDCFPPGDCTQSICDKLVYTTEENTGDSCVLSLPSSTLISTMSDSCTLLRVYHRKKLQKKPHALCSLQMCKHVSQDGFDSAVSSESLCGATNENAVSIDVETEGFQSHPQRLMKCGKEAALSKSPSCDECPDSLEPCSDEAFRSDTGRRSDHCSIDDSCCSSKLNLDCTTASVKGEVDDTGECSSSGALVSDGLRDNSSEKEIFISIFRGLGLLENASCQQHLVSVNKNGMTTEARVCRVCDRSESTLKMLICDQCEDAFHDSCCNPQIRRKPTHEWFCYSCLKKRCKILVEKNPRSPSSISNGSSRCRHVALGAELGPIASMFNDNETYYSKVRVGSGYQAEVPSWSGPIIDEIYSLDEPKEMMESEYLHVCSQNSVPILSPTSIGNWLQCHAVIRDVGDGSDGTTCGKWRRAPLFEVQADNWECFCAVLWDPLRADCAVAQELPADEVLKQLKYIEMLRPRLTSKKRKLNLVKTVSSREMKEA